MATEALTSARDANDPRAGNEARRGLSLRACGVAGRVAVGLTILALALLPCAGVAHAQPREAFEYDPYRVRIWVAGTPQLPATLARDLAADLAVRTSELFGATARIEPLALPPALGARVANGLAELTAADIAAGDPSVLDWDKLWCVAVDSKAGAYRLTIREFDCKLRVLSEPVVHTTAQAANLGPLAQAGVLEVFAPLVRIERVQGEACAARVRGGGLIVSDTSPAAPRAGDLYQPVLRRTERGVKKSGEVVVEQLPFTYLEVQKQVGFRVECAIHSGVRGALGSQGARTEKLALRVKPNSRGTRIVLRTRGTPPVHLVDYEILTREPGDAAPPAPLGFTDLAGSIQLPLGKRPITLVYVRHGQQMLARVPIVPGLVAEQVISLTDDDPRLAAESVLLALQHEILDIAARREVLAARIRLRLDNKQVGPAEDLLSELRALRTRADLLRQVDQQATRIVAADKPGQQKVDKIFGEIRKLLAKQLDPKLVDEVAAEVRAASK